MKIRVFESQDNTDNNATRFALNISNVFDIKSIVNELAQHDIQVEFDTKRHIKGDIWALPVYVPYVGKDLVMNDGRCMAEIFLYADYENRHALAMSRRGADKAIMLLISSVANKHIRKPFTFNKAIRDKL